MAEYIFDKLSGDGFRCRQVLDAKLMNRILKSQCAEMSETPLLASLTSLIMVIEYLKETGVDADVLKPLLDLVEALDDLTVGIENVLFRPAEDENGNKLKGGGRAKELMIVLSKPWLQLLSPCLVEGKWGKQRGKLPE